MGDQKPPLLRHGPISLMARGQRSLFLSLNGWMHGRKVVITDAGIYTFHAACYPLGHCSLGFDICGMNTIQPLPLHLYAYTQRVMIQPYHNIDRYCKKMGAKIIVSDPVISVLGWLHAAENHSYLVYYITSYPSPLLLK